MLDTLTATMKRNVRTCHLTKRVVAFVHFAVNGAKYMTLGMMMSHITTGHGVQSIQFPVFSAMQL